MIKALFDTNLVGKIIQKQLGRVEKAIIASFERRGEQFVIDARDQQTWSDDTGNLRSSIGYFIYKGGQLVSADLEGTNEGVSAAKNLVSSMPKNPHTMYLIGVAGMNYAAVVESKGFNVISTQAMTIIPLIEQDLERITKKLS